MILSSIADSRKRTVELLENDDINEIKKTKYTVQIRSGNINQLNMIIEAKKRATIDGDLELIPFWDKQANLIMKQLEEE